MWDKLLHYTIGKLQQENNGSMSMAKLAGPINMEKATQFTWVTISMLVLFTNLFNNYHKAVLTEHHHFAQFYFVVTWQNSWPPDETLQHVWPSFGKLQADVLLWNWTLFFFLKWIWIAWCHINRCCCLSNLVFPVKHYHYSTNFVSGNISWFSKRLLPAIMNTFTEKPFSFI